MRTFIILILTIVIGINCSAQSDTILIKEQKGFLFLSNYNYLYDYEGGHIRPLGFHDYFFPSDCIDLKCLLDSNVNILFKNGVRVDSINNGRDLLKTKASAFSCIDTSDCYMYDKFYIIPVTIDYKVYEDNWPYSCKRNYYELQVINGARLRYEYLHKAIKPLQITRLK